MKVAKCTNPKCGFTMIVRKYTPKICPLCGNVREEKKK